MVALVQTTTLPNSLVGEYIRIGVYHVDYFAKEATAAFFLYTNAAAFVAAPNDPLSPTPVALIRLSGTLFDTYLAFSVLASSSVVEKLYDAVQTELTMVLPGSGLSALDLSGATDV